MTTIKKQIHNRINNYISWCNELAFPYKLKKSEQEIIDSAYLDLTLNFIHPFYVDYKFESEIHEDDFLKGQLYDSFKKLFDCGGLELIDKLLEIEGTDKFLNDYKKIMNYLNLLVR